MPGVSRLLARASGRGYIACPREKWTLTGFEGLGLGHLRESLAEVYQVRKVIPLRLSVSQLCGFLHEGNSVLRQALGTRCTLLYATQALVCLNQGGRKQGRTCA